MFRTEIRVSSESATGGRSAARLIADSSTSHTIVQRTKFSSESPRVAFPCHIGLQPLPFRSLTPSAFDDFTAVAMQHLAGHVE